MTARMGKAVVREWVAQRVGGTASGRWGKRAPELPGSQCGFSRDKMMDALINLM
jgi:hypothetical protein